MSRMNKINKIRANHTATENYLDDSMHDIETIHTELQRVSKVMENTPEILEKLDDDFEKKTSLRVKDVSFLMTATALQVVRQYIFENKYQKQNRLNHKDAAKEAGVDTNYDRETRRKSLYYATLEEILNNPVPFDATKNAQKFGIALGGGKNHRTKTLGHDPVLGWIFGTANIATRTITVYDSQKGIKSYHVQYGNYQRVKDDFLYKNANTWKVVRIGLLEPLNPKEMRERMPVLAASLILEGRHLNSDVKSKESLNIPGVEFIPEFVNVLSKYGVDMANLSTVGRQASLSISINAIIGMIHRMMYDETIDGDIKPYEVRTRKILSYSNVIASLSNVVDVVMEVAVFKNEDAVEKLDVGGLLVTIARLFSDAKFIANVKEEFLRNGWQNIALGDELEIPKRDILSYLKNLEEQ